MRLSNNCCVLLHISPRLSIFKTDDLTALPLLASVVCLLACKSFIISPTIWRMYVYVQDAHKHSASLYCFFFVLAVGYDDEIGALVKILIICWNQFLCQSWCMLSRTAEPTTLDRQHSSSIGVSVTSPIMLSPLSSHPKQRADLVAEYLDDVSHPRACGVPVVLK